MIEEELKGLDIDGSGKITICAHQIRNVPGNEKYICFQNAHVSLYYLEQEEIATIGEADSDTEPMMIWKIVRNALLDIAQRNHCPKDVTEKIEKAFEHMSREFFHNILQRNREIERETMLGIEREVEGFVSPEAMADIEEELRNQDEEY